MKLLPPYGIPLTRSSTATP